MTCVVGRVRARVIGDAAAARAEIEHARAHRQVPRPQKRHVDRASRCRAGVRARARRPGRCARRTRARRAGTPPARAWRRRFTRSRKRASSSRASGRIMSMMSCVPRARQRVREEHLGVEPRVLDAARAEVVRGPLEDRANRPGFPRLGLGHEPRSFFSSSATAPSISARFAASARLGAGLEAKDQDGTGVGCADQAPRGSAVGGGEGHARAVGRRGPASPWPGSSA